MMQTKRYEVSSKTLKLFFFQVFAVQLISHLALQYPIPKSFAMSKYVIQRMDDMLAALPVAKRNQFFVPALKCLARISKAFPPVREEVTELLLKLGRVAFSQVNKTSFLGKLFRFRLYWQRGHKMIKEPMAGLNVNVIVTWPKRKKMYKV